MTNKLLLLFILNIDVAIEAKKKGMKVVVFGSAAEAKGKQTRHSSGRTIFDLADIVVDSCAQSEMLRFPLKIIRIKSDPYLPWHSYPVSG